MRTRVTKQGVIIPVEWLLSIITGEPPDKPAHV